MRRILLAIGLLAALHGASTVTTVHSEIMASSVGLSRRKRSEPALGCDHHRRSRGSSLAGNQV